MRGREEAPHADGEELGEAGHPVHAVGEHANRPRVGAPVIDDAARDDQLGKCVAQDQILASTGALRVSLLRRACTSASIPLRQKDS